MCVCVLHNLTLVHYWFADAAEDWAITEHGGRRDRALWCARQLRPGVLAGTGISNGLSDSEKQLFLYLLLYLKQILYSKLLSFLPLIKVCEAIRVLEQSKGRLRGYIDQLLALVLDRNPSLLEGLPRIQQNMGMSPDLLRLASLPEVEYTGLNFKNIYVIEFENMLKLIACFICTSSIDIRFLSWMPCQPLCHKSKLFINAAESLASCVVCMLKNKW